MELKSLSGVRISIEEDQGTKVLIFDQPVRVVALGADEAARIGASLYRNKRSMLFESLVSLVESGFLNEPRTIIEIKGALNGYCPNVRTSSIAMSLAALTQKHLIHRTGKRRNYKYKKA